VYSSAELRCTAGRNDKFPRTRLTNPMNISTNGPIVDQCRQIGKRLTEADETSSFIPVRQAPGPWGKSRQDQQLRLVTKTLRRINENPWRVMDGNWNEYGRERKLATSPVFDLGDDTNDPTWLARNPCRYRTFLTISGRSGATSTTCWTAGRIPP